MFSISFEYLKKLSFPEFAESDDLADWQAKLAELDGHIAGIATTILAGGWADTSALPKQIAELLRQLQTIKDIPEGDEIILAKCKEYLYALEQVVHWIKNRTIKG